MSRIDKQSLETWLPRTLLGKMVLEGRITTLDEVFNQGYKIKEVEIVDSLLADLQQEVLDVSLVQKQTDAGEKSRFKALAAVGNFNGYIGIGAGKSKQVRDAIQKAVTDAKLKISPVRRGCGSWECNCGEPHSVPFNVTGKCGSVTIRLIPGPRGLGIVASDLVKMLLRLAGIKDCWTRSFGTTRTTPSFIFATWHALQNTYGLLTQEDWSR